MGVLIWLLVGLIAGLIARALSRARIRWEFSGHSCSGSSARWSGVPRESLLRRAMGRDSRWNRGLDHRGDHRTVGLSGRRTSRTVA